MKKSFLVTLTLVCLVALSCAVAMKSSGPANPDYKNLKVLPKDITHEQMDSVMHHFTASLGVRCNFCHVRNQQANEWNWASDDNKHKLVAREMMTMTNELNKKYFNLTGSAALTITTPLMVTCYTCHQGATDPVVNPPKQEEPQPRPAGDSTRRN
jgi:hypothetical protein